MARAHTKCTTCDDLLWFLDIDVTPQAVRCVCGDTVLLEEGPRGNFTDLTQAEIDSLVG